MITVYSTCVVFELPMGVPTRWLNAAGEVVVMTLTPLTALPPRGKIPASSKPTDYKGHSWDH